MAKKQLQGLELSLGPLLYEGVVGKLENLPESFGHSSSTATGSGSSVTVEGQGMGVRVLDFRHSNNSVHK